jgi:hypothetical protein
MALHHFLILYDVARQALIETIDMGTDGNAAVDAYARYEDKYRDQRDIEIVLIGADSIETIKRTHSQYFAEVGDDFFSTVVA